MLTIRIDETVLGQFGGILVLDKWQENQKSYNGRLTKVG